MKNLNIAGAIFGCLGLFICSNVFADQIGAPIIKTEFKAIDVNKNGYITPEEMQAHHEKNFKELDKNKNGVLEREEIGADETRVVGKSDKNKDGKVTRQESSAQFREYFQEMDADKDNKISEDEYTDYWKLRIKF
ncbi:MAG: EF-hand domain-containing protein [Candidatus Omnitrophota bacterium]|jgi:Ca2+-binding EF-hand superfamily protein